MDGTVLRPCGRDNGVDVLSRGRGEDYVTRKVAKWKGLAFGFGGVGFGLQAFLTTFSNEDISLIVAALIDRDWLTTLRLRATDRISLRHFPSSHGHKRFILRGALSTKNFWEQGSPPL